MHAVLAAAIFHARCTGVYKTEEFFYMVTVIVDYIVPVAPVGLGKNQYSSSICFEYMAGCFFEHRRCFVVDFPRDLTSSKVKLITFIIIAANDSFTDHWASREDCGQGGTRIPQM